MQKLQAQAVRDTEELERLTIEVETLRAEVAEYERKKAAEEEDKNKGVLGKLQDSLNEAMFKKRYELEVERSKQQTAENNEKLAGMLKELTEKQAECISAVGHTNELSEAAQNANKSASDNDPGAVEIEKI